MLEGIEELLEQLDKDKTVELHEDHRENHYLVRTNKNDGWKQVVIPKVAAPANHQFTSLEGFISYLNSDRCKPERGIIFVGERSVSARLRYQDVNADTAVLNLEHSEEFKALLRLTQGVSQKDLWRLLNTHLFASLPLELLIQISNIKLAGNKDKDVQISDVGQVSVSGTDALRVVWSDPKANEGTRTTDICKSWCWQGRIWGAFSKRFQVSLVLEIDAESVKFTFHAQQLETVMRSARLELVTELTNGLQAHDDKARFTVHEGSY